MLRVDCAVDEVEDGPGVGAHVEEGWQAAHRQDDQKRLETFPPRISYFEQALELRSKFLPDETILSLLLTHCDPYQDPYKDRIATWAINTLQFILTLIKL